MKLKERRVPGKTIWILLIFMTLLMVFPLLFYFRLSTLASDILEHSRKEAGYFGLSMRFYLDNLPFDSATISRKLENLPLPANIKIEVYDSNSHLVAERRSGSLERESDRALLYRSIKNILDPMRAIFNKAEKKDPQVIRRELLERALGGQKGVDYLFLSGELGNRVLYFSYPLYSYSGQRDNHHVRGALLLEHRDESLKVLLQRQRNQFSLMCLIFLILLTIYVFYILMMLVLPLRRLLGKSLAVIQHTDYLFPDEDNAKKKNEIGAITRSLDRIAEMLDEGDREIEQYMEEFKHVIRNPLSVIQVSLDGLMMDKKAEKDLKFSSIIQRNLSRIDNYISSYSGLPEDPVSTLPAKKIDIAAFLDDIVKNYTPLAETHHIRFELEISESPILWKGYYSPLLYAVEQIINNAIDFSPENGVIRIEAFRFKNRIDILIKDQGKGIPSGKEQEIFKRYVSYREKARDKHTGTGLYLSLKALKKIGGDVSAGNNTNGGAGFTITLPLGPFFM